MNDLRGRMTKDGIRIYEDADFAGMRAAGRVAAEILDAVASLVVPGTTTAVIDDFITEEIKRRGVTSATIVWPWQSTVMVALPPDPSATATT